MIEDALADVRRQWLGAPLLLIPVAQDDKGAPPPREAVDFAHYYADDLLRLEAVDGARFEPARLTVVTPPWNFPVAIPAGGVLAALAAGSGVILKPAPQSPRCAAVLAEAIWEAGVPRDALALAEAHVVTAWVHTRDHDCLIALGAAAREVRQRGRPGSAAAAPRPRRSAGVPAWTAGIQPGWPPDHEPFRASTPARPTDTEQ